MLNFSDWKGNDTLQYRELVNKKGMIGIILVDDNMAYKEPNSYSDNDLHWEYTITGDMEPHQPLLFQEFSKVKFSRSQLPSAQKWIDDFLLKLNSMSAFW